MTSARHAPSAALVDQVEAALIECRISGWVHGWSDTEEGDGLVIHADNEDGQDERRLVRWTTLENRFHKYGTQYEWIAHSFNASRVVAID